MANSAVRVTGDGDVTTGPTRVRAISADITTAGVVTLRAGGAGGTVLATLGLVAGNGHFVIPGGLYFKGGLHADYDGTLAGGLTFWIGDT